MDLNVNREKACQRRMALPGEEWRGEDILSESYLDAFYKAHVVSRRGPGGIEDDIAAIEAEIQK